MICPASAVFPLASSTDPAGAFQDRPRQFGDERGDAQVGELAFLREVVLFPEPGGDDGHLPLGFLRPCGGQVDGELGLGGQSGCHGLLLLLVGVELGGEGRELLVGHRGDHRGHVVLAGLGLTAAAFVLVLVAFGVAGVRAAGQGEQLIRGQHHPARGERIELVGGQFQEPGDEGALLVGDAVSTGHVGFRPF